MIRIDQKELIISADLVATHQRFGGEPNNGWDRTSEMRLVCQDVSIPDVSLGSVRAAMREVSFVSVLLQ